ncbi:YncE family protein [Alteriqipengyuania lutimaris]|uniref:YncE family protein n=2 Tax=Alteriqipengyuania lutimaris TaxID=1538146 RepID=A0A395LG25_9SPHN|nr:DNA-binding beta-propeller fold protein YncE [Alteriqipengyuania lutimaris]RDS75778.1 YncE family protein [Alteriqipengyuania lutimaris]
MPSGTLFVANKRGNTLSQIDLATGDEVRRVEACATPHELATSPDGQFVALACYGGREVAIFEADDLTRVRDLVLGEGARPHGIEWHPNGDIYVTAEGRKSIYWIQDPLGSEPRKLEYATGQDGSHMLAVSPDARNAWTMDLGSGTVTLVDLITRRAPLSAAIGEEPEGIDLSPDGEALWVSARGSNRAYELDPATLDLRNTIDVGRFALRLAIRPQGDVAVTSNLADASLSVIDLDTSEVVRTIAVDEPDAAQARFQVTILWSPDGERIYVAETGTDTVAEVDYKSGRVLRRIATGDGGDGLAIVKRRPAQ